MIKLETVHQEMNNEYVRQAAHELYRDWMWKELDELEHNPPKLREYSIEIFKQLGHEPSKEHGRY